MSRFSFTLVLALCLGLSVAACDRDAPEPAQESSTTAPQTGVIDRSQAGELMPAVNVSGLDGSELNLGALQGDPVLVNLWATWCAPCVKEMPLLDDLAGDYDGRLRVIAVSQDFGGKDKVESFLKEREFTHLEPRLDPQGELGFAIGGGVMPTTILYDAAGQEVWRVQGDYDWSGEEARNAIDEAIGA